MKLREKIRRAAYSDAEGVVLSHDEAVAVWHAIEWGERILESLNAEDAETEGGNAETSGLDEDYDT